MSLWKLRLTMLATLAMIIGTSTIFFAVLMQYLGYLDIISLAALVIVFNFLQWLLAPYLINAIYRVKEAEEAEFPKLHAMISQLSSKSRIKKPKIGIAGISIPNAFAYGSPISGTRIAVTEGLLNTLEEEEVEAVLGHEMGHLKHKDVQIMMFASFLPSLIYFIGRSALYSAYFGGYYRRDGREGEGGLALLIGALSIAVYFVLLLFTLGLSRLREYYADQHSASVLDDGRRKLSEGLAKIVSKTNEMRTHHHQDAFMHSGFKALFISDPDNVEKDAVAVARPAGNPSDQALVERLLRRRVTATERIVELFSTHPNITKRLGALGALGDQPMIARDSVEQWGTYHTEPIGGNEKDEQGSGTV